MSAVPDYKRKVYAIRDLPTLPVIARKVLTLADDDEKNAEKLTAIISSDQALAVKVLGLANSAYYGYRAKIGTIRHAVIVIGTNMLKQLSLSVLVSGTLGRGREDRAEFWKHSFGTATASAIIAKRTGISDGDLAFMAGLIHDIGKMIIDTYFPNEHGMQHTEVGGWMGERWQLPQHLINAIVYHHSLASEHLSQPIIACVQAADACAKLALTQNAVAVAPEILAALKLSDRSFNDVVEELRNRKTQIDELLM